ncbi:MAG: AI-2E family transporter [Mariprofundaceae bacterium]|nr:AI-2E family transporter [Mariprofundaceae bacterium]
MFLTFLRHPLGLTLLLFFTGLSLVAATLIISGPILITLAISLVLYAAMRPSVDSMVRNGIQENIAVAVTMVLIIAMLILSVLAVFPLIVEQVTNFSSKMAHVDVQLLSALSQLDQWLQHYINYDFDPASVAQKLLNYAGIYLNALAEKTVLWFNGISFSLILIPLIVFFLLRDFNQLRNETLQLLPNRYFELGWLIYNGVSAQLENYIRGLSIQAFVVGTLCGLGFYFIGLEFAPLLGIIVALLNLIPFFGISLAKIPPLVVVLLSDQPDFMMVALTLAVLFFVQAIDTTLLLPKIVAKSANLHPLTVMLSVALAGYYYGFFGFILVVPVLFSMKVIFKELLKGLRSIHAA